MSTPAYRVLIGEVGVFKAEWIRRWIDIYLSREGGDDRYAEDGR